jgi:SHOCT-like protein
VTESRRRVLEMLAAGQINADEADRLIGALQGDESAAPSAVRTEARPKVMPKYLRVIVDANEPGEGPVKINVRIPLMLLRAGVKLTSLIPAQAQRRVNEALHEQGIDFDISQVKPENLNELIDHLSEFSVDIDQKQDNVKIQVFCE